MLAGAVVTRVGEFAAPRDLQPPQAKMHVVVRAIVAKVGEQRRVIMLSGMREMRLRFAAMLRNLAGPEFARCVSGVLQRNHHESVCRRQV